MAQGRPAPRTIARGAPPWIVAAAVAILPAAAGGFGESRDPDVRMLSPAPDRPTADRQPAVRLEVSGDRKVAVLIVDGTDVTAMARPTGKGVEWRPESPLAAGPHQVKLVMTGPEGTTEQEWTIVVETGGRGAGPGAHARGGLSLSGGFAVLDRNLPDRATASGSVSLTAGARHGAVEASLAGSASFASTGPGRRVAPGGFLAKLQRGDDALEFGDVSFTGTPYTAASLARRGLLLTLHPLDATLQAFQLAANPVQGLAAGIRFDDLSDQLIGGALRARLFRDGPLQVAAVFLEGRTDGPSGYGVAGIGGPTFGRTAGLQLQGTLLGTAVGAEAAFGSYDPDTRDGAEARSDVAASLRLARNLGPVSLQGAYERIGPDFATVGNPSVTGDRQQASLSAATAYGFASLSANLGWASDNLAGDAARPVVSNTSAGTTLGIAPPGWPSLTLGWFHAILGASSLPAGQEPVDQVTDTATAAATWSRRGIAASLSSSLSWLADRRPDAPDTRSASAQLSASARLGSSLTLAPSLARAEVRTAGETRVTDLAALTLAVALIPRTLTLQGQGSWATNRAGALADTEQWNAVLRLGWEIHRLSTRLSRILSATLSASGRYARLRDRGPQPRDEEVYGAFVSLDLHLPYDLRWEP